MVSVDRTVCPDGLEYWNHLLALREGAHCGWKKERRTRLKVIWISNSLKEKDREALSAMVRINIAIEDKLPISK